MISVSSEGFLFVTAGQGDLLLLCWGIPFHIAGLTGDAASTGDATGDAIHVYMHQYIYQSMSSR